ncbi:MAG: hypothetical protein HY558_07090, partial [Euryarchaeota archaeon]|nr:hypothetical protein [Euryarchaeota archaeon]
APPASPPGEAAPPPEPRAAKPRPPRRKSLDDLFPGVKALSAAASDEPAEEPRRSFGPTPAEAAPPGSAETQATGVPGPPPAEPAFPSSSRLANPPPVDAPDIPMEQLEAKTLPMPPSPGKLESRSELQDLFKDKERVDHLEESPEAIRQKKQRAAAGEPEESLGIDRL